MHKALQGDDIAGSKKSDVQQLYLFANCAIGFADRQNKNIIRED